MQIKQGELFTVYQETDIFFNSDNGLKFYV